jgi:O-methyltransferase
MSYKTMKNGIKSIIKKTAKSFGFTIVRERGDADKARLISEQVKRLPEADLYCPVYSPWLGKGFQSYCLASLPYTLVSPDRLWVLHSLARQTLALEGEFVECGVYKGGTALLFAKIIGEQSRPHKKSLHLFDTFQGMPDVNAEKDIHRKGDFSDTSLETVRSRLTAFPWTVFHPGIVPSTFKDIPETKISFAHIDVDIYEAVLSCCEHLYPKMTPGGVMVFDDYGFETCPGAREAVDKWFSDKPEVPLVLPTGQAVVTKLPVNAVLSQK